MGQVAQVLCIILTIAIIVGIGVVLYFAQFYLSRRARLFDKAIKKCDEYVKFACNQENVSNQSKPSNRQAPLIGGEDATQGQFPHMAYLSITTKDNMNISCGGSLISDEYILTSAQCVQNATKDGISVKLGSVFRTTKSGEWFKVAQIKIHKKFWKDPQDVYLHDIALLRLTKTVPFSETVRPICLATYVGYKSMDTASVSGWGIDNSGKISGRLKTLKAFIRTGVQPECEKIWGNHFGYYDEMICAGHPRYSRGLCQGDFGGPLQLLYESLSEECLYVYEQLGIASMSNHLCTPDTVNESFVVAYTRVQEYIPWIVTTIWPDS